MKRSNLHAAFALSTLAAWASAGTAQAASAYGGPQTSGYSAKSRAILGGGPSRLELMAAKQAGRTVSAAIEPASFGVPSPLSALLSYRGKPVVGPWTGRPDIFRSVALSVGPTTLDQHWKRVSKDGVTGVRSSMVRSFSGLDTSAKIAAVNSYVNGRVRFVDDLRQYGRSDRWTSARETLGRGRGDCEDYAIAKMQLLRAAGVPASDLFLVLVRDLVRRADHAVLVVRTGDKTLLLDNGTDTVLDTEAVRDYRPVLTFGTSGTWTHGYRRRVESPLVIAVSAPAAGSRDPQKPDLSARAVLRSELSALASTGS